VYDHRSYFNTDIWRIDGPTGKERGSASRWIASSRLDWAQEYSPDGTKIAFGSERAGSNNIWVCGSDGTDCFQLTDLAGAYWPRWSPDSERLVFHAGGQLYIGTVQGRFTRRLTMDDAESALGSWSGDGAWIYFTSDRTGESQIWKMPVAGGEAIQITRDGGENPRESVDGRFLFYTDRHWNSTIRRVPVNGGEEVPITAGREISGLSWTLWGNRIVYVTEAPQDRVGHVESLDLDTGIVERLFSSEAGLGAGLTVSTDGRWILLSMGEPETGDIMLVEGFR
jgi:Tol biopolymer transport system component